MIKQVTYTYLGTNGTLTTPIHLEGIYSVKKIVLTADEGKKLTKDNIKSYRLSFPMYDTPTGRIIGACILGKPHLCEQYFKEGIYGWFSEGGGNIDPLAAIDFYAADRRYNLPKIELLLNYGINVILDRFYRFVNRFL